MKTISSPPIAHLTALAYLLFALATALPRPAAAATIKTWDGSSSGLWSAGANWSGGTRPQNGDELHFPQGVSRRTMTNDISNLSVTFLWFPDDNSTNYVLLGNALTLGGGGPSAGVQCDQTNGEVSIECPLTLIFSSPENAFFVSAPGGTLRLKGAIVLPGQEVLVRSLGLIELSGVISGNGDLRMNGQDFTVINGSSANTFVGNTLVQGGDLVLSKNTGPAVPGDLIIGLNGLQAVVETFLDNQIADTSIVHINKNAPNSDTRLDLRGNTDTIDSLIMAGGIVTNGTLTIAGDVQAIPSTIPSIIDADVGLPSGTHTISVSNSASLDIAGVISGKGGLLKAGGGSLRFSGAVGNTYLGNTEVRAGTLDLVKTAGLSIGNSASLTIGNPVDGAATDTVRYSSSTQLSTNVNIFLKRTGLLDLNNFVDALGDIDMVGGDIETGTGTLQLRGALTAVGDSSAFRFFPAQISGKLDLGTVNRTFTVNNSAFLLGLGDDLIVDAVVSGTGGITKAGPGEMELNGANTYTGPTSIDAGTLVVGNNAALGSSSPGTVVNNPGRLRMAGGASVGSEPLTLNSTASNPGALFGTGVSNFWGGNIFFSQTSRIGVETNSILNLGGALIGPGGFEKEDAGELILTGLAPNTYAGITTVKAGTLFCNKNSTDAIPGDLVVGDGVGGTNADIVFFSLTQINDLSRVTVNSSGLLSVGADTIGSLSGSGNVEILNTGELILGGNNDFTTFSGVISGGGDLVKRGTGVFTLTGHNLYTGATTVEAGALIVNGLLATSDVTVRGNATLAGVGTVRNLSVATTGNVSPGSSPGRLTTSSTTLSNDAVLHIELNGPVAGVSYDQLKVFGALTLTGSKLDASLGFPPFEGEIFTIIDNNGSDPVTGTFDNLANGAVTNINGVPLRINYNGLTGNDVTLTVTNLAARGSTATITTGNGDGRIDPNECNQLFLRITNSTGASLTNIQATLSSVTPGVVITEPFSAYPDLKTLGAAGTNLTAFQFFTTTNFLCGQSIEFLLTLSASNQPPFAVRYILQSGILTASQSFTNNTGVGIPPGGATASGIVVSNIIGGLAKVTVSMALTHQNLSELEILLIPPGGPAIPLVVGLPGTQLGTNCTNGRVTFDDDALQPIEAGASPYVGTFRPDAPLSIFDGDSGSGVNGTWLLEIIDLVPNTSVGALSCWSLTITPATCVAGSGACSVCNGPFTGSITSSDPAMATTIPSSGAASTCNVPKTCPGFVAVASHFDAFTFTNANAPACVAITLDSPCITSSNNNIGCAAYLNSFNPANPCQNYLADIGDFTASPRRFAFNVAANAKFVVVVGGATNADCPSYTLRVDGFDCPVRLGVGRAPNGGIIVNWPNHANGFNLEWTTNLPAATWSPLTNVPVTTGGDFVITNDVTSPNGFYRLRKP